MGDILRLTCPLNPGLTGDDPDFVRMGRPGPRFESELFASVIFMILSKFYDLLY